jgi:hypothetical protein
MELAFVCVWLGVGWENYFSIRGKILHLKLCTLEVTTQEANLRPPLIPKTLAQFPGSLLSFGVSQ